MSYALVILDPQYDYLPGGNIESYNATDALTNIVGLISNANLVVSTRDQHPVNHFSFSDQPLFKDKSWPPHCIEGTKGAKIFPAIRKKSDFILSKGMNPVPPDAYSAFTAKKLRPLTYLIDILEANPVDEIVVCGFLLEIGVKYTAFDFNAIGHWQKVTVPLDCCGTLTNAAGTADIITPMIKAGISIVDNYEQITII